MHNIKELKLKTKNCFRSLREGLTRINESAKFESTPEPVTETHSGEIDSISEEDDNLDEPYSD